MQDKAIPAFRDSPFYLTGGTALSRGYFNHRYSDDLDYFVNYHHDFQRLAQIHIDKLSQIFASKIEIDLKGEYFFRIFVGEERLKIELINDVPSHAGNFLNHSVLGLIDSRENILANKLTAIVDRALPKDIVDIYFLLNDGLSIKKALTNAESKAAGTSPLLISKIISEFDYELIEQEIKWVTPVAWMMIKQYMVSLAFSIVRGTL